MRLLRLNRKCSCASQLTIMLAKFRKKIDSLRADGTNRVVALQNSIDATKRDRSLTKEERENRIAANRAEMEKAKGCRGKEQG